MSGNRAKQPKSGPDIQWGWSSRLCLKRSTEAHHKSSTASSHCPLEKTFHLHLGRIFVWLTAVTVSHMLTVAWGSLKQMWELKWEFVILLLLFSHISEGSESTVSSGLVGTVHVAQGHLSSMAPPEHSTPLPGQLLCWAANQLLTSYTHIWHADNFDPCNLRL